MLMRVLLLTVLLVLLAAPAARAQSGLDTAAEALKSDPVYVDPDADWVHLPDPIADAIKVLSRRIAELERELASLRGTAGDEQGDVVPLRPVRGPNPAGG